MHARCRFSYGMLLPGFCLGLTGCHSPSDSPSQPRAAPPAANAPATTPPTVTTTPPQIAHPPKPDTGAKPEATAAHGQTGLVGKWESSVQASNGNPVHLVVQFFPNGTEDQVVDGAGTHLHIRATYTARDNKLTEKYVGGTADGKPLPTDRPTVTLGYKVEGDQLAIISLTQGADPMHLTRVHE